MSSPPYTVWQAVSASLGVALRAIEEVRALSRQPGPQGERGDRGLDGEPGKLTAAKEWHDGVHYAGDVVFHNGGTYQATKDTAREPGHADWACLAAPGRAGADGRSWNIRETYSANETYEAFDVVTLNYTWFIAKRDNPGPCPGPDWKAGPTGKRGDRGEPGQKGDKGDSPDPLVILDWRVDRSGYTAVPVMSDGSDGPALRLRGLFEQFQAEAR